jgi:CBS-domain-containing membrane protein
MNISDICTQGVKSCSPKDSVATAAALMWECDCGAVPVLDGAGKLVGVITDRDICIAVATRRQYASEIPVGDVMSGMLVSCKYEDAAQEALRLMREHQIRRLPILDEAGHLKGMVSVNDILLAVEKLKVKAPKEALLQEVMVTLMAISQHRSPRGLAVAEPMTVMPGA